MEIVRAGDTFARQGWYPAQEEACDWQMGELLRGLESIDLPQHRLRAGIVPHAGWMFSGELAAMTIGALARHAAQVDTVVLFGGHLGPGSGSWVLASGRWPTPVGSIEVDSELAEAVVGATGWRPIAPGEYRPDNTIELQMPLLRRCFPDSKVLATGVSADPGCDQAGARVVGAAQQMGRDIAVVGSTDLTHYGPNYGFEPAGSGEQAVAWVKEKNDARAVALMEAMDADALLTESLSKRFCCCPGAAAATLGAARELGARRGKALATRTSHDIHPTDSFVGYAAVVF